jgi:hypothetical protein
MTTTKFILSMAVFVAGALGQQYSCPQGWTLHQFPGGTAHCYLLVVGFSNISSSAAEAACNRMHD